MGFPNPVAVYIAGSNLEAVQLCELLSTHGIDAHAVEDESRAGAWMFGLASQVHRPKVWVDRTDEATAATIIADFERQRRERRALTSDEQVAVVCEECKKESMFPDSQRGSVQDCPKCGAFVDVGEADDFNDWQEQVDENDA